MANYALDRPNYRLFENCYAEELDKRWGGGHWGKGALRRTFGEKHWNSLHKWQREAKATGVPIKVFVASMGDVMDDEAPAAELQRLFDHIDACPDLIFQLLTKRPHRYAYRLPTQGFQHGNVWLGATCENQHYYDLRWPILRQIARQLELISWISYEPAIGSVSIKRTSTVPDWIIFGGVSGSDAKRRPMELTWAESLRDECERRGAKFFIKQMSARTPKQAADLIPVNMLIRQFPNAPLDKY